MKNTAYMTRKIFFALGTVCTLTVYDGNTNAALKRCYDRIMQIHNRMNAYDKNSEVSAINAAAGKHDVRVSDDTLLLIEHSAAYSRMTGGLYDITSRPLSQLGNKAIFVTKEKFVFATDGFSRRYANAG